MCVYMEDTACADWITFVCGALRLFSQPLIQVQVQVLYCHVHNNYSKVVIGNEILSFQAASNNAQTICSKKITQEKERI